MKAASIVHTATALLGVFAGGIALSGCADKLMSDTAIRDKTALSLGQAPSAVMISDRQYDGLTNTYYTARTPAGSYRCTINGGSVLALGITNPPQCNRL